MNTRNENHKETEAHVIKVSGPIERIQKPVENDEENASVNVGADQVCENGVCMVTWKPQRPAA